MEIKWRYLYPRIKTVLYTEYSMMRNNHTSEVFDHFTYPPDGMSPIRDVTPRRGVLVASGVDHDSYSTPPRTITHVPQLV